MARAFRWPGTMVMATLSLTGCAVSTAQATPLDPAVETRIAHACQEIMGFAPGQSIYRDCVTSLHTTMATIANGRRAEAARETCAGRGLQSGTQEFAKCVMQVTDTDQTGSR